MPHLDAVTAVRIVYESHEVNPIERGVQILKGWSRAGSSDHSHRAHTTGPAATLAAESTTRLKAFHPKKSNLKPIQRHGDHRWVLYGWWGALFNCTLMWCWPCCVLTLSPSHTHSIRPLRHVSSVWLLFKLRGEMGFQGKIYIICLEQSRCVESAL